ncbi:hypothetical protein ABW20_dc0107877 [Dactylellina cionopaga]|nr:hypothetical protein ABW20_dc0107877 [Dactylellina cionopaga]
MFGQLMNISESDQQFFFFQRMISKQAKLLTGQRPPSKFTRTELIQALRSRTLLDEGCSLSGVSYESAEFKIEPYAPSKFRAVEKLTKIYIDDLKLETRHRDEVVFVRTIVDAKRLTSVSTIVEDENGDVTQLQVFNMGRRVDLEEAFPKNQIIAIKEPLFMFSSTAVPSIRVDHISDMVMLHCDDVSVPKAWSCADEIKRTADDFKNIGNQAMKIGKTGEALKWYTAGLEVSNFPATKLALLLNRSLTHLRRSEYDASLIDAESALLIDPTNEKALYRKAKSLYHLRRFGHCGNTLLKLTKAYPNNQEAKQELMAVRQRILEETLGRYDFKYMVKMAKNEMPGLEYDFADYTLPVYAKSSEINGNGLFTKKDTKMGGLLFCVRAFANCKGKEENGVSLIIDPEEMRVGQSSGAFLGNVVIDKLGRVPSVLPEILKLHSSFDRKADGGGDDKDESVPIIDSFIIKDISRLNSFSSCSYSDEFPEMRISSYFELQTLQKEQTQNQKTKENPFDPNCGLWILPSYMNHSCVPNARRVILGDMMILRAAVDMPKDTEILISYTDPKLDYETRREMFQTSWGFTCTCPLCIFQSTPGIEAPIDNIMSQMYEIITRVNQDTPSKEDTESLKVLCDALEKHYVLPADMLPRPFLGEHLIRLYSFYNDIGMAQEAFAALHLAPRAFGAVYEVIEDIGPVFWHKGWPEADLVRAYVKLANITGILGGKLAKGWRDVAREMYKVVVGEDETFEETFGEAIGRWMGE